MTSKHLQPGIVTADLARAVGITPEGIRVRLCKTGSYWGLVPSRLPNGRLLWPADSIERLKEAGRQAPIRRVAVAGSTETGYVR